MPVLISYIWWHHKIFIKDSVLVSIVLKNAKYGNCLNLFLFFIEKGIIGHSYKNKLIFNKYTRTWASKLILTIEIALLREYIHICSAIKKDVFGSPCSHL